jgi:hypothetical protein
VEQGLRQQAGFVVERKIMKNKIKRFNWRITEQTAAEMAYRMKGQGYKSWDEFICDILARSENQKEPQVPNTVKNMEKKLDQLLNKFEESQAAKESKSNVSCASIENIEQEIQSLRQEFIEVVTLVRRFTEFLSTSMDESKEVDEETAREAKKKQREEWLASLPPAERRAHEALDRIRRRY